MYETFVKQLIDMMDELSPVTSVRNRIEMPLGSVQGDMKRCFTTIRNRMTGS